MRNGSYENSNVADVIRKLPEARAILREARIDSTSKISLREAALAASVNPDELTAQIEASIRRAARRRQVEQPAEEEFELVW